MTLWTLIYRINRACSRLMNRVRNYLFFRGLRHGVIESWNEAGRTVS